jgi:hypothetical protein
MLLVDQPQVGFMNQRSRLHGMAVPLAPEQSGGHSAEIRVYELKQVIRLLRVALGHLLKNLSDARHLGEDL